MTALSSLTSFKSPPLSQLPLSACSSCSNIRWFSSEDATKKGREGDPKGEENATTHETSEGDAVDTSATEIEELQVQLKELKDQLLRSYAEQENIRQIARNDVAAANSYSIRKFAKSLLDVADNLDRALGSVDQETLSEHDSFRSFYEGIELTKSGLVKALQSNGVTSFCEEPGDKFDPELHEALMEYPDPTSSPGSVGLVMKKGYMLNGRVLRPAEVGVIKK
jgi:molecular chaperone GrpE